MYMNRPSLDPDGYPMAGWSFITGEPTIPQEGEAWSHEKWEKRMHAANLERTLQRYVAIANHEVICEVENLSEVSAMYVLLFHRTKVFTATVRQLVSLSAQHAPQNWADAACLLVEWSVNVLRNEKVGFERFLHSQRESIYWILDDALLRIMVNQWEDNTSRVPWDQATAQLRLSFSRSESLIPEWEDKDLEEMRKWRANTFGPKEVLEDGYFKRSRSFLHQSTRIHEIWRTVRLCGRGQLPAELANAIVEDVSMSEELPMGSLKTLYFPKGKEKT